SLIPTGRAPRVVTTCHCLTRFASVRTRLATPYCAQVDRGDPMPLGPAQLVMSYLVDGQLPADELETRDEALGVSSAQVRHRRRHMTAEPPEPHPEADHPWRTGRAWQVVMQLGGFKRKKTGNVLLPSGGEEAPLWVPLHEVLVASASMMTGVAEVGRVLAVVVVKIGIQRTGCGWVWGVSEGREEDANRGSMACLLHPGGKRCALRDCRTCVILIGGRLHLDPSGP
ncbi:hypothetical protein Vretifemale_6757, partial [Volvox reticuliferus]